MPPNGTAGLARSLVSGSSRSPLPPAMMKVRILLICEIRSSEFGVRNQTIPHSAFRIPHCALVLSLWCAQQRGHSLSDQHHAKRRQDEAEHFGDRLGPLPPETLHEPCRGA